MDGKSLEVLVETSVFVQVWTSPDHYQNDSIGWEDMLLSGARALLH